MENFKLVRTFFSNPFTAAAMSAPWMVIAFSSSFWRRVYPRQLVTWSAIYIWYIRHPLIESMPDTPPTLPALESTWWIETKLLAASHVTLLGRSSMMSACWLITNTIIPRIANAVLLIFTPLGSLLVIPVFTCGKIRHFHAHWDPSI